VQVQDGESANAPSGDGLQGIAIQIEKADGKKCDRCWNYSIHVGENTRYPTICERCTEALAEIESTTAHATP
jgi:isoleucyl-tRNA synthetase